MGLLRKNQDSLVAVLEAFVYDPLIDWFSKTRQSKSRVARCVSLLDSYLLPYLIHLHPYIHHAVQQ